MTESKSPGFAFEDEVRAVARALWNLAPNEAGAELIGGDEVDCICRTEDMVHLIECTTERSQNKTDKQINKLVKVKRTEEKAGHTVKLWIVTKDTPTAEQRTAAREDGVTILSIDQFKARLIDPQSYLKCRLAYRFGSASDLATDKPILPADEYVPLPMIDIITGENRTVNSIADMLLNGETVILTGPFGAGKSLTVREIFNELRRRYFAGQASCLPLSLNLREHWGQEDVSECLHRHARAIAFSKPEQLVRAWNGGRLIALLDGFDELAPQAWRVKPAEMKANRRNAVSLIREFVHGSRQSVGTLIAGRSHYFDSPREMLAAFDLRQDVAHLELSEFTDEQAREYLSKKKINLQLPEWLPRKPLLLGYLAVRGLLHEVLGIDASQGQAFAWDKFIAKICEREASAARDIDAEAVRQLFEYLATRTRSSASGIGPLTMSDLAEAYRAVTGYDPLEPAMVLLGRLPVLTSREQEAGTRSFVDADMLDALRASSVARFIQNPYHFPKAEPWKHPLGELGYAVAALKCDEAKLPEAKHRVAASEALGRWSQPVLALDCLLSGAYRFPPPASFSCDGINVIGGTASTIDFENLTLANLLLDSSWIELLRLGGTKPAGITLTNCVIERIEGITDESGVPDWIQATEILAYDDARTVSAILAQDIPLPTRVLLTIIRKLFEQRGRGRSESALTRGLTPDAQQFVSPILRILQNEEVVFRVVIGGRNPVWHPRRSYQARMREMLASPKTSPDSILVKVRQLS